MSPNRKADLQRKLAMAPLPKPPAGLAERIKSEIPKHLLVDVQQERKRLSQSIFFNMRVAASVIFLVLSVYLALFVLSRGEREAAMAPRPSSRVAEAAKPQADQEVRQQQAAPSVPPPAAAKVAPPPDDRKQVMIAEAKPEPPMRQAPAVSNEPSGVAGGVAGGAAAGNVETASEAAPAPAPPPAAAAQAMPAAPQVAEAPARVSKSEAKRAVAGGFVADAVASGLPLSVSSLFGIPLHAEKLEGVALIEHFAAPAVPPHAIRLDAEAAMLDDMPLLRVSVDLPEAPHPAGSSLPPVGADAKLDVDFDDAAVVSHRAFAGSTSSKESVLPSGGSVTALFSVELKPDLSRRATVATVHLHYRSVVDGKEHEITKKLRRSDIREWNGASRRMKAASLAAALVEKLEPAETIAEKARAAHLDELAALAER